jgi:hypothetical protein
MKNNFKFKSLVLLLCYFMLNFDGIANERIKFTITAYNPHFTIVATQGKQFTVDWGDHTPVEIYTGEGIIQFIHHTNMYGTNRPPHTIIIEGTEPDCIFSKFDAPPHIIGFDASDAPSIKNIDLCNLTADELELRYCNVNNCSALEILAVDYCSLKNLDLTDCISLRALYVNNNKLSVLDVSNTTALEFGTCIRNCLPLSQCYAFMLKLTGDPMWTSYGRQTLPTQSIMIDGSVDYSSEKEFGGVATQFLVAQDTVWAPAGTYSVTDGIITFHTGGIYTVIMYNPVIVSLDWPPVVYADIRVLEPVQEIINVPAQAIVRKPLDLTGTVLPTSAITKEIIWSVYDAGSTGANICDDRYLYSNATGTVIVTATIKDGLGIDRNYTQNFTIEVKPLGINEPASALSKIKIYPNPVIEELSIENDEFNVKSIEVFDERGNIVCLHSFHILSANHTVDVSHLNSGIYFVRIVTEAGEAVRKVVKQ